MRFHCDHSNHIGPNVSKGRDKLGRGVPLSLCQRKFLVPVSLFPGTRAGENVPGQTPLSWDVPGQNQFSKSNQKTGKGCSKTGKGRSKTGTDVLKQEEMF
jgi:hypothetical protein